MKICSKCKEEKPATANYFYRCKSYKDGLKYWCKTCVNHAQHNRYLAKNPNARKRIQLRTDGLKQCTGPCKEIKAATAKYFYRNKSRRDGLCEQCKICTNTRTQVWNRNNPEKVRKHKQKWKRNNPEYDREWAKDNPEKCRENRRRWNRNNPEKVRESIKKWNQNNYKKRSETRRKYKENNQEKIRKDNREWRRNNPEKVRTYKLNYRARKINLPATLTAEQKYRSHDYFGNCCAICGRSACEDRVIALDHWVAVTDPRPDNPGTVAENMIPLCKSCNSSKNNSDPIEWLGRKYGKREATEILGRVEKYFLSLEKGEYLEAV